MEAKKLNLLNAEWLFIQCYVACDQSNNSSIECLVNGEYGINSRLLCAALLALNGNTLDAASGHAFGLLTLLIQLERAANKQITNDYLNKLTKLKFNDTIISVLRYFLFRFS